MVTSRFLTLDRLFNDVWGHGGTRPATEWLPPVDVVEEGGEIRISTELPGVKPEDLKISVEGTVLSIHAQKQEARATRAFTLPTTVDAEGIKATYEHGVLTVVLPQAEKAKARQIPVSVTA